MESNSSCLICGAALCAIGPGDDAYIKVEMETDESGSEPSSPSRRPRFLLEGAASSEEGEHVRSLCKLMGLPPASCARLQTGLPSGDRIFCDDCTCNLCSVSQLFKDILKLQRKVDRFKSKVKSQIRKCQNIRSAKASTMDGLREILVKDVEKKKARSRVLRIESEVQDDNHYEGNDADTGSDPQRDLPWDSDSDHNVDESVGQLRGKTEYVQQEQESGNSDRQQYPEFRLKECTVNLHNTITTTVMSRRRSRDRKHVESKGRKGKEVNASSKPKRPTPIRAVKHHDLRRPDKRPICRDGEGRNLTRNFICTDCPAAFQRQTQLNYHCLKNHQLSDFTEICSNCGKRFLTKSRLVTHAKMQGGTCKKPPLPPDVTVIRAAGPYQYQCSICNVKMTTRSKVFNHITTHTKIKEYICDICGNNFTTNLGLVSHKLCVHPETVPDSEHPHRCFYEGCGRSFGSGVSLRIHQKNAHLNLLDFPCTQCDFRTYTATLLRIHVEIDHLGLRKYECKVCGVAFKRNGLKKHMLAVHTSPEDRPYKCKYPGCGMTFCDGYNQRRHEVLHTGEKPNQCQICQRRFAVPEYLRLHMKNMHKPDDRAGFQEEAVRDGTDGGDDRTTGMNTPPPLTSVVTSDPKQQKSSDVEQIVGL